MLDELEPPPPPLVLPLTDDGLQAELTVGPIGTLAYGLWLVEVGMQHALYLAIHAARRSESGTAATRAACVVSEVRGDCKNLS